MVSLSFFSRSSGMKSAITPTVRAGSSSQAIGSSSLRLPVAYRPTPKASAPQVARIPASTGLSLGMGAGSLPMAAKLTPPTITRRTKAASGAIDSPKMAAMVAAIAPSVARIGAMTPTLPILKALAASTNPVTLPKPAAAHQSELVPASPLGVPAINTNGIVMTRPMSIGQATVE